MVNKATSTKALKEARKALRRCGHYGSDLELIVAKVPILRFHRNNIQIDLNVNNLTGLRNTWLLNAYSAATNKIREPRIKPLATEFEKIIVFHSYFSKNFEIFTKRHQ